MTGRGMGPCGHGLGRGAGRGGQRGGWWQQQPQQSQADSTQADLIERLMRLIDKLETRITQLEEKERE